MLNKISDNDIKKAFKLCLKCEDFTGCRECPAKDKIKCNTIPECRLAIFENVLKLINRLEAENERLKKSKVIHIDISEQFKKECEYEIKTAKAEAYKEFADKVKKLPYYPSYTNLHKAVDNLLKEMVGEDNET